MFVPQWAVTEEHASFPTIMPHRSFRLFHKGDHLEQRQHIVSNGDAYSRHCHRWDDSSDDLTKHVGYHRETPYLNQDPPQNLPPAARLENKQATVVSIVEKGLFSLYREM